MQNVVNVQTERLSLAVRHMKGNKTKISPETLALRSEKFAKMVDDYKVTARSAKLYG